MDPQKQKQLINQMYESSAKSQEDLDKMTPEERKEYLQSRLKQKMFFSSAQRQNTNQKKKLQEKMQEKIQEVQETKPEISQAKKERNRRKRLKKKEKLNSKQEDDDIDDDVVVVDKNDNGSESDYHSD